MRRLSIMAVSLAVAGLSAGCGFMAKNDSFSMWGPNKDGVIQDGNANGMPPTDSVASFYIQAPEFMLGGRLDAKAAAIVVIDGVAEVGTNVATAVILPTFSLFKPIVETIFGPPANGT